MCMCSQTDDDRTFEDLSPVIEIEELDNNKYRCTYNGKTINIFAPNYETALDRVEEQLL